MQILVAEDDRDIAVLIAHYFARAGWTPHVVTSGDAALAFARQKPIDLAILDVMLPGLSGLDVCRAFRANPATAALPIIMVTARTDEHDRIIGLDVGADDYVGKPFSPNELVARVRALARRAKRSEPGSSTTLSMGPLSLDLEKHVVSVDGAPVTLAAK